MGKTIYDTKIKPNLRLIENLRSEGKDIREVADFLGIKYATFNEYLNRYEDLLDAWIDGEHILAERLEATAMRVALGYDYEEKKIEEWFDKKGRLTGKKITTFVKHEKPNSAILQEGLKVLRSKKWNSTKNKKEIEVILDDNLLEYSE